tara:strand:+ start:500 stop:694 length:195 start_codon:yes stop_codon:yes gene_type:complete
MQLWPIHKALTLEQELDCQKSDHKEHAKADNQPVEVEVDESLNCWPEAVNECGDQKEAKSAAQD